MKKGAQFGPKSSIIADFWPFRQNEFGRKAVLRNGF
jgi:hypothetical protein